MLPLYLALCAVGLLFLFPFYWVVISSLKSVDGINLRPPALYPAEAKTVALTDDSPTRYKSGDDEWLLLAESDDLLGTAKGGGYFLQLDGAKPTQLVKWLSSGEAVPEDTGIGPVPVKFDKTPVYEVDGKQRALIAKMVRQKEDQFDELLFTVPVQSKTFKRTDLAKNPDNHELREFSAHPDNFTKALQGPEATIGGKSSGFLVFMKNSLFISLMAVLGQILASSLVAFGFARLNFKGRETLFILLIATLMVPAQVTLIPLFTIYKSLGWIDTFLPLIVPHFTGGAFNVFLIRQFMTTLPKELDESAAIDGASAFRVYRSIILPMCAPVLIVVGLFTFVASWQDVMGPLIYLDNPNYRTVSLGLEFFRSPYVDNRPLLMAGAVLSMIPVALLFLVAQRYIMSGIATTGLK
jgi:multiple sugar transport system permease protein